VRWCVSGDANVDGGMNVVGNADICGNVMLTSGTSLVQQVHIRATTASSSSTSGALVVSGGAEYKKRECWRYAGVVGDMDVSGSAVVYGGMNVVGNADICGNVLLTSGSSAVQQVHIRATTASTDTISGRWWWRVGRG
jgi:carbonic anhydrase/acetyltransferase-like protein (isoleucine patch superfamily)